MTIHTFEVSSTLTNDRFYSIQKDLKLKDCSKWMSVKNGMKYFGLSEKGIIINMYQIKKKDFYSYSITYRISARRVMNNDDFVGLFNAKDYIDLKDEVNQLLKSKSDHLPKLNHCKLRRLDFCVNAELDNQEQVKAYIKTAKRSNIPAGLEVFTEYDKTSKRTKPTKDDYTVFSDRYIAISIYNKYREMKKQKDGVFPASELERAKNIVRIEIRCMENKIKTLKKKYDIKTISEFMSRADKIGNELYKYYLSKIFNKGTIYTVKEALSQINNSEYKTKTKKLLKEFLSDSNESRSVGKTYRDYKKIYGKHKTKHILELLDDIDTNCVTVTTADSNIFDNGYIPTPLELYKEFR